MSDDARHRLGHRGEQLAADHLERLGYRVVARNHRTRYGELDLVVTDDHALVFVEVKTARASASATPWDSLHIGKRGQVRKMAGAWLTTARDRPRVPELRFDAIGVLIDDDGGLVRLEHLEAAF